MYICIKQFHFTRLTVLTLSLVLQVGLQAFCHSKKYPLVALLFVHRTFVSHGHTSLVAICLCQVAAVRCSEIDKCQCVSACQVGMNL